MATVLLVTYFKVTSRVEAFEPQFLQLMQDEEGGFNVTISMGNEDMVLLILLQRGNLQLITLRNGCREKQPCRVFIRGNDKTDNPWNGASF